MSKTIITPSEVAELSGVKLPFNPCDFRTAYFIEYYEFRTCLGLDFLTDLDADLVDYSAVLDWDKDSTYNTGDLVKFKGVYYISLIDSNGDVPTLKTSWECAPKFTNTKYEDLYCYHLGPYLAKSILARRLPFIISQINEEGVLQYAGNEYKTSNEDGIERLRKAIYSDRAIIFSNMDHYLTTGDNKTDTIFSNYLNNKDNNCEDETGNECRKNKHKIGGYRIG